MFGTTCV
jgi:hypothetical protein